MSRNTLPVEGARRGSINAPSRYPAKRLRLRYIAPEREAPLSGLDALGDHYRRQPAGDPDAASPADVTAGGLLELNP